MRYTLQCDGGHRHDSDFPSIAAYEKLEEKHLLECPCCGSHKITRAPMAPAVLRGAAPSPSPAVRDRWEEARAYLKERYADVGDKFPKVARAMENGDDPYPDKEGIVGTASPKEAQRLAREGVRIFGIPRASLTPNPSPQT
jgi:hypothetical protein